jgi:hypothetical protein
MRWIKMKKAQEGGTWNAMVENKDIFRIAHMQTVLSHQPDTQPEVKSQRKFDIAGFRTFLLHVYAISVLFLHFKSADSVGDEAGNFKLNHAEFRQAVQTLCATRGDEVSFGDNISDEDLDRDFAILDINNDGQVAFIEVIFYPAVVVVSCIISKCYFTVPGRVSYYQ